MHSLKFLFLLVFIALSSCQSGTDPQTLRFKMIADAQQQSNDRTLREANGMVKGIAANVEQNGNTRQDMAVLMQARDILAHTQAAVGRLQGMQAAMLGRVGSENQPHSLESREIVAEILARPNATTSIDSVHHQLRVFAAYMRPLLPHMPESLGLVPEDAAHRTLASRGANEPAVYGSFYFEETTAAEALAVLAQQQAEVLRLGLEGVTEQSSKVGSGLTFHKIGPYAIAESKTVRPGETYKADLMMVTSGRAARLHMTANGDSIPVEASTGRGRVQFVVSSQLPAGQSSVQAYWDGTISFQHYGRDTTFRLRVPYTIQK